MNNFVVAIGASAGGLEAIHTFFDNIPSDTSLSFVVIQHLSPDHKSLLVELVSKHTDMKVYEAEHGQDILPNSIYIIPHRKFMTMKDNKLELFEKENEFPNTAIDVFISSLARERKDKAVAIILSGAGSDGSRGIEEVKANGGIVLVQEPTTAKFNGMPNSAVATGCADLVLAPEKMPEALISAIEEQGELPFLSDVGQADEKYFKQILELVRDNSNTDFSGYKRPTIIRRMIKRMSFRNIRDWSAYFKYLKENPGEVTELSKEFLIGVTRFFRDSEAFEILKKSVFPELIKGKNKDCGIKIWSVGCSTGEEPYSIAMALKDYMETTSTVCDIKIFATDIDKNALSLASKGIYTESTLSGLSPTTVKKFFVKEGSKYRISSDIRKLVVFATHNVLEDPPFSKIDLIVCRNMLIYLTPNLQRKVFDIFQFSINPGGFLFIGPSENISYIKAPLMEIDKKWKIYKFPQKSDFKPLTAPLSTSYQSTMERYRQSFNPPHKEQHSISLLDMFKQTAEDELNFAGILITTEYEVKQAVGNFQAYLGFEKQESLDMNLMKMVLPDLGIALGSAIRKALKESARVVVNKVKVRDDKKLREIDIAVKPYTDRTELPYPGLFIVFSESKNNKVENTHSPQLDNELQLEKINELEAELSETRETLRNVIQDLESANEELVAANEELNSSNEEMNSSNEELQSLNEELYTLNAEHQMKIKELQELNDDLNNFFRSANIGQVFLDRNLIIRKFTPSVTSQFNLIESDIGRSISHISHHFKTEGILADIQNCVMNSRTVEKEVVSDMGRIYQMKIMPYLRQDMVLDGAVITFVDITELVNLNNIIAGVFNSSLSGIIAFKAVRDTNENLESMECIALNRAAKNLLFPKEDYKERIYGKRIEEFPLLSDEGLWEKYKEVIEGTRPMKFEHCNETDGVKQWFLIEAVRMRDGLVLTFTDISETKETEQELQRSFRELSESTEKLNSTNAELERANYDLWHFASMTSHDLKEPLRKIQTYGSILNSRNSLGAEDQSYLKKIMLSAARMKNLIEDILNYTRLSNHEGSSYKRTDLNEVLREVLDDMEISIKEKKVEIKWDDLPTIDANPVLIRQVFQNFLSNAIKFSKDIGGRIEVSAEVKKGKKLDRDLDPETEYCALHFRDNGIGFDEKYAEQIFTLFKRLHNKDKYEGTGIGLAICKKIAETHKGKVSAKGQPNHGSIFTITLPVEHHATAAFD